MKKELCFVLSVLAVAMTSHAQLFKGNTDAASAQPEWKNIEVTTVNTIPSRANVIPYDNENDIEKGLYTNSPYYLSLNGTWEVNVQQGATSIPDPAAKDFSTQGWTTQEVPSTKWYLKGSLYKTPQIKQVSDAIGNSTAVATYSRTFRVSKTWSGRQVFLKLRAKSAYVVWVNGKRVGYAQDSRLYSEFDITKEVISGKDNRICVQVFGTSVGSLLEMGAVQDQNGINGDVYLYTKNSINLKDYTLRADYNTSQKLGTFELKLDVENPTKKGKYYVEVELWNPQGKIYEKMGKWVVFDKKKNAELTLQREFAAPAPWTAETPNLYTCVVRLRDKDMAVLETIGTRFGFRSVVVNGGLLKVNEIPITLRGVVYGGYTQNNIGILSHDQMKEDLQQMKANNINAVRTAYYSPMDEYFYQLCDEYGLYVICDANITPLSNRTKAIASDANYEEQFAWRVENMYNQLRNHPSIIAWSLGNGVDNGMNMEAAYRMLRRKDMQRPVIYAGAGYSENTDVIATINSTADDLKVFAVKKQNRPLILFAHGSAEGNNFGSMEPFWQIIRSNTSLQGGFLINWRDFTWYDQTRNAQVAIPGMLNNSGVKKPYLDELRNIYRPFDVRLVRLSPDAGEFVVENYLDYRPLNDYNLEYTIFSNLKPRIIEGDVNMDLLPKEAKNFKLKIPKLTLYAGEILYIRFTTKQRTATQCVPQGTVLGVVEFPLPMVEVKRQEQPDYAKTELMVDVDSANGQHSLHIYNDNIDLQYNLTTADITSLQYDKTEYISSAPRLNFWRPATDNDQVDHNAYRLWRNLDSEHLNREVVSATYRKVDNSTVSIDVMLRYANEMDQVMFDVKQSYVVQYSGDVLIDNEIVASEKVTVLPKVGLQMTLPNIFDSIQWLGLNQETYKDRKQAGMMGTYRKPIEQMFFCYDRPQEAGNYAEVRWLSLIKGMQGLYVDMLDTTFNFSIYPYTDKQLSTTTNAQQLSHQNKWTLNIDYQQSAIGSALAGVPIRDEDLINAKNYHFRVHLRAYNRYDYAPQDFRRVLYSNIESNILPMPVISKNKDRFDGPMKITLSSKDAKAMLFYTLDGTTPTQSSLRYTKPFTIDASTVVKARAFKTGSTPSFTSIVRFNYDYITKATFKFTANTPYNYNQEEILFDAEVGDINDLSHGWLGFSGNDLNVVFQLSKQIDLQNVEMHFAHVPEAWAFAPKEVFVYVSTDGEHYSEPIAAKIKYDPAEQAMNSPQLVSLTVDVEKSNVQYVRIVAKNLGKIPTWHKAKGLKPWLMCDEIILNEVIH